MQYTCVGQIMFAANALCGNLYIKTKVFLCINSTTTFLCLD